MNKITLLVACLISTFTFSDTLLHVGNLIDVSSGEISKAVTIRISGNKIESITKGYAKTKSEDQVINLKQSFVLPGFMDMHVHLAWEYVPKAERPTKVEPEFSALFAANSAKKP